MEKMGIDPQALRKIVTDLEKITIDPGIIEKNSSFLGELSEGVQKLDNLPISLETEPFFFRTFNRQRGENETG
jgi:hypothetical protein